MISDFREVKREVKLGDSKLDFLVGNTYIEVKTPLTTNHVKYGENIKEKPTTPFPSTERFTKHINGLLVSLDNHERAILLTVYQYDVTEVKPHKKKYTLYRSSKCNEKCNIKKCRNMEYQFSIYSKGCDLIELSKYNK